MSKTATQLNAGALLPTKTKVDKDATETIVARSYRHAALGDRPVIRLGSDRLGEAEDLAMEFLGFEAPKISKPIAVQQRRSLGFAAWALINDPDNARYALELVKRMKAAARKAKSKPGHAWDAYADLSKELGRSARHFLPPYWEEVGRTFKDLGNQTYAGRALNKSLEAERVHALESDRARRRDVVLEFALSGCLAGKALSEYTNDLLNQYEGKEAYEIFRDLCTRRTRGGMAPWAAMPKDFLKMAKAADLDGDAELEKWLLEVVDTPAMGRAANQFWKHCNKHCKRLVASNSAFAIALLRHTRPEERYYGASKLSGWLDLVEQWDLLDYLWNERSDAPALGEPIADWFGRIVRDETPVAARILEMLSNLAPRLKKEKKPLALSVANRWGRADTIDIDVLEACLVLGVKVDDPPQGTDITFRGWLAAEKDHDLRNQDVVESWKDERFSAFVLSAMDDALGCRGGVQSRRYWEPEVEMNPFPTAAGDRDGIKTLWRLHAESLIQDLEGSGLESFENAKERLEATLWPDTLRLFPDLAERLSAVNSCEMLQRTLQAGVLDEYGWLDFETYCDKQKLTIKYERYGDNNISLTFPHIVVNDKVHAHLIRQGGEYSKVEVRTAKANKVTAIVAVGDQLAIGVQDRSWERHFFWTNEPKTKNPCDYNFSDDTTRAITPLDDESYFLGKRAVRIGDKKPPECEDYFHDGERFWTSDSEYDDSSGEWNQSVREIDPQTGKKGRRSVPAWFEKTDGGELSSQLSELRAAPAKLKESPLGMKDGLLGWKTIERRDGSWYGEGIDGRRWDKPLRCANDSVAMPIGLLQQPGTDNFLPISTPGGGRVGLYTIWDPTGTTEIARIQDFEPGYAKGQVAVLPIHFWHLLQPRHLPSSKKLRGISDKQCQTLLKAAANDGELQKSKPAKRSKKRDGEVEPLLENLLPAVKKLLPKAPERMVLGVAHIVAHAEREGSAFEAFREKNLAASKQDASAPAVAGNHKVDAAVEKWDITSMYLYADEDKVSTSAHLNEAAAFLKGESAGGQLPRTKHIWFSMLDDLPMGCWRTFWKARFDQTRKNSERDDSWLEFLEFWIELGIAELPGEFAIMEGVPDDVKKKSWGGYDIDVDSGMSFTLQKGKDFFIFIEHDSYDGMPYEILRYSTAKTPGTPPGYKVKSVRKIKSKADPELIKSFSETVRASEDLPLPSKEELAETADRLAASPTEIGLVWIGGLNIDAHENNFLPADLRKALGWKVTDANAGRQALMNLKPALRTQLYQAVMAAGLTAPFAEDRGPVLKAIEKTWRAKMPKRLPLDAALQKRLSAIGSAGSWHRVDHEELLGIAAEPAKHPALQPREIEIRREKVRYGSGLGLHAKKKTDPDVDSELCRSIAQLVSMIHAESAAGSAARADMPALIKQAAKMINGPKMLLDLRTAHLYEYGRKKPPKPSEWLTKNLGKTKADKDTIVRFDDALISAAAMDSEHVVVMGFRPSKLKSESDLNRLLGLLALKIGEEDEAGDAETVAAITVLKSPGFQKLATAILAKNLPDGAWPQDPLLTAPKVVAAIEKKLKLSQESAIAYLQLLALPNPTTANMRTWNGWTPTQLKKITAELEKQKLVLIAKRARAGRTMFLPGEWAELKTPWLPIETWKLKHLAELDLDTGVAYPLGGPMVLRPFEDLFAAAWQRVVDGDEPKYDEVKRKRK